MDNKPVLFTCKEILDEYEKHIASGMEHGAVLDKMFKIGDTARAGPQGTKWGDFIVTANGKVGRPKLRFIKETHTGQIPPLDDAEVTRLNSTTRGQKYPVSKRDKDPSVLIMKYRGKVETDDNGKLKEEIPKDRESPLYAVIALFDEFFRKTMRARIASRSIAVDDDPDSPLPAGTIAVQSPKVCAMAQSRVSPSAKSNPGMVLANPMARMKIPFDKDTGMPKRVEFRDFTKSYFKEVDGKKKKTFEILTFEGNPVTAHNIHNIAPYSTVSGIANMGSVCYSNLGISLPMPVEVLVVDPPKIQAVSVDDVFDDDEFDDDDDDNSSAAAPAAPAAVPAEAAETAPAPDAPAAMSETDFSDVLDGLDE